MLRLTCANTMEVSIYVYICIRSVSVSFVSLSVSVSVSVSVCIFVCVISLHGKQEDILERTTYKKELGGATIDGGMFNEASTVEDRHEFLRKIFSRFVPYNACVQNSPNRERI